MASHTQQIAQLEKDLPPAKDQGFHHWSYALLCWLDQSRSTAFRDETSLEQVVVLQKDMHGWGLSHYL